MENNKAPYQFAHISAYYHYRKRESYAYGDIKSGDAYDSLSMYMFRLSSQ